MLETFHRVSALGFFDSYFFSFYFRNLDSLPISVPRDVIERLKGFVGLSTNEDIEEWYAFCENSPYQEVRG